MTINPSTVVSGQLRASAGIGQCPDDQLRERRARADSAGIRRTIPARANPPVGANLADCAPTGGSNQAAVHHLRKRPVDPMESDTDFRLPFPPP